MKVLVACEESQAVTIELRKRGHEAYSCDILPCSGGHPEWHIQGDVLPLLKQKWDMIIAFPPCTYLSNVGAARLYPRAGKIDHVRYKKGLAGRDFFMAFYNADCPRIAVENPLPNRVFKLLKPTQFIQLYEFGHPYSKKTYLWLKGLPNLKPTKMLHGKFTSWVSGGAKNHRGHQRKQTGTKLRDSVSRSKTFLGIAVAMAEQWTREDFDCLQMTMFLN